MSVATCDVFQLFARLGELVGVPAALLDNLTDSAVEGLGRFLRERVATIQTDQVRRVSYVADRRAKPIGLGEQGSAHSQHVSRVDPQLGLVPNGRDGTRTRRPFSLSHAEHGSAQRCSTWPDR